MAETETETEQTEPARVMLLVRRGPGDTTQMEQREAEAFVAAYPSAEILGPKGSTPSAGAAAPKTATRTAGKTGPPADKAVGAEETEETKEG